VFTLVALAVHGALYLAWRTTGPVRERSLAFARGAWTAALVLWAAATAATAWVRPDLFSALASRPWALLFVALAIAGAWGAFRFPRLGRDLAAFLSSSAFLLGMLAATLAGQYPFWLRSTLDPSHSLTASNSASDHYGLRVALTWWPVGIALVAVYFTFLFRWMRGKVGVETGPSYGSAIAGRVDSPGQRV
jgi:cytochrome bd ubiquinol oxidase subunit II